MMSLPLIVGALLLFCGAPAATAATDCDWALALDSHPINASNIMEVKSVLAADSNAGLFFFDLPAAITFDTGQLILSNGGAVRVWNLTFLGLPAGAVSAMESAGPAATVSAGIALPAVAVRALEVAGPTASLTTDSTGSVTTLATAGPSTAATPTSVPEAPSLLYLGSGLILCGGFWLRRRRF